MLNDTLPYFDEILQESGNGVFADTLRKVANYRTLKSEVTKEQEDLVSNLLMNTAKTVHDAFRESFNRSAIQQFTQTELTHLDSILNQIQKTPITAEQRIDMSFAGFGNSIEFPTPQFYLNVVRNSPEYINLNNATKKKFDDIVNSPEFTDMLEQISTQQRVNISSQPMIKTILDDAEKKMSKEDFTKVKNGFKAVLIEKFASAMFPAIKSFITKPNELPPSEKELIRQLASQNNISEFKVASAIGRRDVEMMNQARMITAAPEFATTYGPVNLLGFGTIRKFNLDNELDTIAMKTFYDKNKILFENLFDKEHLEAIDDLMTLAIITGNPKISKLVKGIPTGFSTAMAMGRTYNVMKGVVSWRYVLMEKVISDYRLAQAEIMKSILSNSNTAVVMRDILSDGIFKPKEVSKMILDMGTKLSGFGYRLQAGASDEIKTEFKNIAQTVATEKAEEKKEEN